MAAARVAAGKVVVRALVPILVPVVGLVQVAAVLLLLLLEVGAALLLAVGQRWGQLCSAGAVLQLLLAADGRGAAMYLAAVAALSEEELEDVLRPPTNASAPILLTAARADLVTTF